MNLSTVLLVATAVCVSAGPLEKTTPTKTGGVTAKNSPGAAGTNVGPPLPVNSTAGGRAAPTAAANRNPTAALSASNNKNSTATYKDVTYITAANATTGLVGNGTNENILGKRFFINLPTFQHDKTNCTGGQARKSNGECGENIPEDW